MLLSGGNYVGRAQKLDMGKGCRFKSLEDLALDVIGRTVAGVSAEEHEPGCLVSSTGGNVVVIQYRQNQWYFSDQRSGVGRLKSVAKEADIKSK